MSQCLVFSSVYSFYCSCQDIMIIYYTIIYNKPTRCNSGSIVFINNL